MAAAKMPRTQLQEIQRAPPPHTLGRDTGRELISKTSGAIKAAICPLFISRMKKGVKLKRILMRKNIYLPKECTAKISRERLQDVRGKTKPICP